MHLINKQDPDYAKRWEKDYLRVNNSEREVLEFVIYVGSNKIDNCGSQIKEAVVKSWMKVYIVGENPMLSI